MAIAPSEPCPCRLHDKAYRDCCEPAVLAGGYRSFFEYSAAVSHRTEGLNRQIQEAKHAVANETKNSFSVRLRFTLRIMHSYQELWDAYIYAFACEQEGKLKPEEARTEALRRAMREVEAIYDDLSEADYRQVWGPNGLGRPHSKPATAKPRKPQAPRHRRKGRRAAHNPTTHEA